jgi:hypothetical protein
MITDLTLAGLLDTAGQVLTVAGRARRRPVDRAYADRHDQTGLDRPSARVAAAAIITDLELDHWQHRATRTLSLAPSRSARRRAQLEDRPMGDAVTAALALLEIRPLQ